MIEVRLSTVEAEKAFDLAAKRNSKNGKVPNYRETKRHGDFEIHLAGVKAELAFAKILDANVDERFLLGGDNRQADLIWGGLKIEVKATMYDPPIIKFNELDHFQSDLAVVAFVKEDLVKIYGGVSRKKFLKSHFIRDFGYGKRYCIGIEQLTDLSEIATALKLPINIQHA